MILAVETSDILCSVAFRAKGRNLLEFNMEMPMQHAALLGKLVNEGLKYLKRQSSKETGISEALELVAVGTGPGSFTGLRIGLSFVQGLCYGRNLPVAGISEHQVLARYASDANTKLFTMIEARRDEVFLAEHRHVSATYSEVCEHSIVKKEHLARQIEAGTQLICKQDLKLDSTVRDQIEQKGITLMSGARFSAAIIAELAEQRVQNSSPDRLEDLEPLYIRSFAGVL